MCHILAELTSGLASASYRLIHLFLTMTQGSNYFFYPPFTDEGAEDREVKETIPGH